ncbi:MAG: hypothetical protein R2748_05400 [Bryobacterales bacterium]
MPTINQGGVVEAAQFQPMVAPGSIASLFGQYLAGGTFQADTIPLPTELGSVQVTVDGVLAPLFYVSNGQINFQIPFETAPGTANVIVNRNGVVGPAEPVQVKDYTPAAFRSSGLGIVVDNATGSLINAGNPATAGQIIRVYMNGFGDLDHPPATGAASASDPLARTIVVPQVSLGDQPVTVYYAGMTPGLVGLGQIDMGLPEELPASLRASLPLTIDFGGGVIDEEELFVTLPEPISPDVGIEISGVSPESALPGDPIEGSYTIQNLTGYTGPANLSFYLRLANSYASIGRTTLELSGVDLSQSAEVTVNSSLSAGNYSLGAQVTVEGDLNRANDSFRDPVGGGIHGRPTGRSRSRNHRRFAAPNHAGRHAHLPLQAAQPQRLHGRGPNHIPTRDLERREPLAHRNGHGRRSRNRHRSRESPRRKTWPLARTVQSCA